MAKNRPFYGAMFGDERELDEYLQQMGALGTWGDELTLRAMADSFGCTVHVVRAPPRALLLTTYLLLIADG